MRRSPIPMPTPFTGLRDILVNMTICRKEPLKIECRYSIRSAFSLAIIVLKGGFDYSLVPNKGHVPQYVPGAYVFTTDAPFDPDDFSTYPLVFVYNAGAQDFKCPYSSLGIFAQDSWTIKERPDPKYWIEI